MLIELIGCTSAGKSTLAQNMLKSNPKNAINLVSSDDFVLRWAHLDWVKQKNVRKLFLNLLALPACLLTWRKNRLFYRFVVGVLLRQTPRISRFEKLKIARITARNVGIFEIVRRHKTDQQVVLADEGTLHIANYLFVHVSSEPDMKDLEIFVQLVSLPDVAIYLKQPESVLISRTKIRGHKRIPSNSSAPIYQFIRNSLAVFEKLIESSSLEGRLVIVNEQKVVVPSMGYTDPQGLEFARKIIDLKSTT